MESIGSGRTQRGCSGEVLEAHEEELNLGLTTCKGGMGGGREKDGDDHTLKEDRDQTEEGRQPVYLPGCGEPWEAAGHDQHDGNLGSWECSSGRPAGQERLAAVPVLGHEHGRCWGPAGCGGE